MAAANAIVLRAAIPADALTLRRWDEKPHVIASDPNDEWNWETELARTPDWREQLIAELEGRPIGFIQIIDPAREESHYWGDCAPNLRAIDNIALPALLFGPAFGGAVAWFVGHGGGNESLVGCRVDVVVFEVGRQTPDSLTT